MLVTSYLVSSPRPVAEQTTLLTYVPLAFRKSVLYRRMLNLTRDKDGSDFMGNRLVVQFARGGRPRETNPYRQERPVPRTRRTVFRMTMTGLPSETSWQVSCFSI